MVKAKKKLTKTVTVERLEVEVRRHNQLYFVEHAPEISDEAFDRLVEELRRRRPDSPVLRELVSDVRPAGARVVHTTPMLSLDKCYDDETLTSWVEKFAGDVIATPKIDGCAVSLRYDDQGTLTVGATRGNGLEGEEITSNIRFIKAIPQSIILKNVEVRGEIYMPLSVFARYRETFANPRNLTAGAIKLKDAKKTADYDLAFFAYDLLGSASATEEEKRKLLERSGFPVIEGKVASREQLHDLFSSFFKRRDEHDFETDGVVFRANRVEEQNRLGSTAHHPRYAIAYKFQGDSGVTTLIDVEWSVSRTGAITPVGIVEPVELSGASVRRASLHNVGLMKKLGVTKGAKVLMMRRGGVIPNLESVVEPGKGTIEIPKQCPSCGSSTELRDDFLYCTNAKNCLKSKVGELSHFVKTVEIDGFGDKLLGRLYEAGVVTDVAELYDLTVDELLRMERMGDVLAAKLIKNIDDRRQIPLDVFLRSFGIRELGKHASKILAGLGSLEKIRTLTEEDLSAIHTIGPVIAREVVGGLKRKKRLIEKLLKRVTVVHATERAQHAVPLQGKSFLFTGTLLSMERKKAEKLVEEKGGTVAQSVTKDLDYLVVGDGGGAGSKLGKAQSIQGKGGCVKIINENKFLEMTSTAV
ncbi:MAG: NAD-dependent DNA ligase LigA [Deltaproteobacteria bacterium]|nr:NAD-dependent DNA ligase LigA [Deltaproteobacteria bacterium]